MYLNLAPNYDALYSPRYIQERGLLHQAQGRWLSESVGYWEANGGYIGHDSKYENEAVTTATRWLINTKHRGQFGTTGAPRLTFRAPVTPSTSGI